MDTRKKKKKKKVSRHCNRLPGEVVESPPMEMFNKHLDVLLSDVVWWGNTGGR